MQVLISRLDDDAKITLQETAGLAIITLHRPDKRNALTVDMWGELPELIERIVDNPKNKVILLRGTGTQFTAGSDIKEFSEISIDEAEHAFVVMEKAISTIEQLPIPTVGVINGPAMGAGLELALACDIRIGSKGARMGIPVGRLGITLNQKFAQRLVQFLGPSMAKDLIYTGRVLEAEECLHFGMLNYLVDQDKLDRIAFEKGKVIASQSPASLYAVKRSVAQCQSRVEVPWGETRHTFVDPIDFPEGVLSFVEKRPPKFERRKERFKP